MLVTTAPLRRSSKRPSSPVPVTASAEIKGRAASVHVLADENEITTQVLR